MAAQVPQTNGSEFDDACVGDAAIAAIDEAAVKKTHALRKLIGALEEHIGALHEWPHAEQQLVLAASPPGRNQLYRFVLFALGNQAPPSPLAKLLHGAGLLRDAKAGRDAWDAFKSFRDGTLRPDAFFWCMETQGRKLLLNHPRPPRDPMFWEDAEALLCR